MFKKYLVSILSKTANDYFFQDIEYQTESLTNAIAFMNDAIKTKKAHYNIAILEDLSNGDVLEEINF